MLHYCLNENWKFEYNNENKKITKRKVKYLIILLSLATLIVNNKIKWIVDQ
jgi:hypothetical protein